MTFWPDARPARPRFRRPRRRPRWTRLAVVAVVLGVVSGAVMLLAPEPPPVADDRAEGPRARARGVPEDAPQILPTAWTRSLPDEPAVLLADGTRGTVVVGRATVSAFRADGTLRWRAAPGPLEPVGALGGNTVLLATADGFLALERWTGERRWATRTPETPAVVAVVAPRGPAAVAVVSTAEGGLAGLDAGTGRPRWSTRLSGHVRGDPVADARTGTVTAVWQEPGATWLRVVDAAAGTVRSEHSLGDWAGSPAVAGLDARRLVVVASGSGRFDGSVQAFDLDDGSTAWRARVGASFQPGLVPLVHGRLVVVVDQLGTVTALDLGSGRRRWRTRTGTSVLESAPVAAAGALLVPNPVGEMITLDRRSGRVRARRRAAGFPIGLVATRGQVVMTQRLVRSHAVQAFRAARLAEPAGGPR